MAVNKSLKINIENEKGVALLAALILILALVVTLGNIFYRHQLDVSRATNMMHEEQAQLMAYSVENWSRQLLSSSNDDRETDHFLEDWAQAVPALPVDGGFVSGCIVDLQGRFNLNSLHDYDQERWDKEMQTGNSGLAKTWMNLLNVYQLPANESQVVSIIDWIDEDNRPLNQWGAEQTYYDTAQVRNMVPNMKLSDISELSVIKGYDSSMVAFLMPDISSLPLPTPINVNTASKELLMALADTKGQGFVEFVTQNRPFDSYQDFSQQISQFLDINLDEAALLWPQDAVGVGSDFFLLQLQVSLGEVDLEVMSIMDRSERDEPVVISRTITRIPDIDISELDATATQILDNPCLIDRTAS